MSYKTYFTKEERVTVDEVKNKSTKLLYFWFYHNNTLTIVVGFFFCLWFISLRTFAVGKPVRYKRKITGSSCVTVL